MSQTVDGLLERLSMQLPTMSQSIQREEVVIYIFEVVRRLKLTWTVERRVESFDLVDGQICMPNNVIRIRRVGADCVGCLPYSNAYQQGQFIRFYNGAPAVERVTVDYIAVPVDKDGEPEVGDALEDACFWWIVNAKLLEPSLKGHLPEGQYERMQQKLGRHLRAARGSFEGTTQTHLEELAALLHEPHIPYRTA